MKSTLAEIATNRRDVHGPGQEGYAVLKPSRVSHMVLSVEWLLSLNASDTTI